MGHASTPLKSAPADSPVLASVQGDGYLIQRAQEALLGWHSELESRGSRRRAMIDLLESYEFYD